MDNNFSLRPFYFLCLDKRQPSYKIIIASIKEKIIFIDTLEDLVKRCLELPPKGVFIDILTSLRFGAQNIMPIDNLGMQWPVMRVNITSTGTTLVLCMDTPKRDTLPNAVAALAAQDPEWTNKEHKREHIRLKLRYRIRIKRQESDVWSKCNGRNLGVDGLFVHTYEDIGLKDTIDIEILDLVATPITCKATVHWQRSWDAGLNLPGLGVKFIQDTINYPLYEILTRPEHIKGFLSGKL
jgi:hypothetical protein